GPLPGFLMGWLMWIRSVTSLATIANLMALYLAFFWAPAAAGWGRAIAVSALMAALTVVNLIGVRQAAGTVSALTIGKLLPLVLFIAVGLFALDRHAFAGARLPGAQTFSRAVFQLVFAFAGLQA